jgi:transcriptional regulator with XRE-family HTH domain
MATFDHRVLHAWRLESGLRAEQVCVQADMSFSYLRALEAGAHRNPSVGLLTRLAAVYGRDVRELFTDDAAPAGTR